MKKLDIHADDYALSISASEHILECIRAGKLDSISVMTNMSCFGVCAEKFQKEKNTWEKCPLMAVHLNFMEGHCVAAPEKLPHLTDGRGYFRIGWKDLFLWNYCPWKYAAIKAELKTEIRAQTERFRQGYGAEYGRTKPLRFDGHQHTQMLPIVYKALLEVIEEEGYRTEYIRVTKEPVGPFLKKTSLFKTYRPVNAVKNLLLNFYSVPMEKELAKRLNGCRHMYLWGVLMSGYMDKKRVLALFAPMREKAEKENRLLEILFHPGSAKPEELGEEFNSEGAKKFYLSDGREAEYGTVMSMRRE